MDQSDREFNEAPLSEGSEHGEPPIFVKLPNSANPLEILTEGMRIVNNIPGRPIYNLKTMSSRIEVPENDRIVQAEAIGNLIRAATETLNGENAQAVKNMIETAERMKIDLKDPRNEQGINFHLAYAYLAIGKLDKAIQIMPPSPDREFFFSEIVDTLVQNKEYERAKKIIDDIGWRMVEGSLLVKVANAEFADGIDSDARNTLGKSLSLADEWISSIPWSIEVFGNLLKIAKVKVDQPEVIKAIKIRLEQLEQTMLEDIGKDTPAKKAILAESYAHLGDTATAEGLISGLPENVTEDVRGALGIAYDKAGNPEKAMEILKNLPFYHKELISIYLKQGLVDQAINFANEQEGQIHKRVLTEQIAFYLAEKGELEKALSILDQIEENDHLDKVNKEFAIAKVRVIGGQIEEAAQQLGDIPLRNAIDVEKLSELLALLCRIQSQK